MLTYTIRRLLIAIPIFLGITVLLFFLVSISPDGGPIAAYVGPGKHLSTANLQALEHRFGLDQPVPVRYFLWLQRLVQGDLGNSTQTGQAVTLELRERIPPTVILIGISFFFQQLMAIPLGIFSALRRYSLFDQVFTVISYVLFSLPTFWYGLMLIILFGVVLQLPDPNNPGFYHGLLPFSGMVNARNSPPFSLTPGSPYLTYFGQHTGQALGDLALHLILPVIVLATVGVAGDSRFMRASMLDVISMDYIRTARAKGLPQRMVIWKHAVRNAILPIVTNVGLQLPALLGGAIVTETIFSWPGMGSFYVKAAGQGDYPVVMAYTALLAVAIILFNLLTDLSYAFVDPRIRYT
jgi:peptide/nickel transport system permease protein